MNSQNQVIHDTEGYRADIDGLRALAVALVVVFHFFPTAISGGFIGVDIFFVISGYLISRHILVDLSLKRFSIAAFYVRRVRRIFPALILTLAAVTIAGWLLLTPNEYELLGRPIAGGAAFAANLVFWREAGYFDMEADTKPLLHLWSLGIEEQFYIVWPFILGLLWRRVPHALGWALIVLVGVSLGYSVWLVQHNSVAAFYSPLSRFWELALGALLGYGLLRKRMDRLVPYREYIAWIGVTLIAVTAAVITPKSAFPGLWAVPPTIGAACLIYAGSGTSNWFGRTVLSSRPMVWIGLISYPLYLWHWPLFSFSRIMSSEPPGTLESLVLIALSIVLAWLTYRLVERPVRRCAKHRMPALIWGMSGLMLLLFISGVIVRKMDGLEYRVQSMLDGDVKTLVLGSNKALLGEECGLPENVKTEYQYCLSSGSTPPRIALLGDSKAEALYYGLVREMPADVGTIFIGSVSAPSREGLTGQESADKNARAYKTILGMPSLETVILVNAMRGVFPLDAKTGAVVGPAASPSWLTNHSAAIQTFMRQGQQVIFVMDNPTFPDPRSCISGGMTSNDFLNRFLRRVANPNCKVPFATYIDRVAPYRQLVASLVKANPGLIVYDPTPLLCDVERGECAISRNGNYLYSYSDHISDYANSLLARDMLPLLPAGK